MKPIDEPNPYYLETSSQISEYFESRKWDVLKFHNLNDSQFIKDTAKKFTDEKNIKYKTAKEDDYPLPRDFFDLAVDTLDGPFSCNFKLRLRVARQMARQNYESLAAFLGVTQVYSASSARKKFPRYESGIEVPKIEICNKLAINAFKVHSHWLAGSTRNGTHKYTAEYILDIPDKDYYPSWLIPWLQVVIAAKNVIDETHFNLTQSNGLLATPILANYFSLMESKIIIFGIRKKTIPNDVDFLHFMGNRTDVELSLLVYFPQAFETLARTKHNELMSEPNFLITDLESVESNDQIK